MPLQKNISPHYFSSFCSFQALALDNIQTLPLVQAPVSRAQALASGSPVERAAALVDLAEDGIGLPLDLIHSADFGNKTRLYFLYNFFDPLWISNIILLLVLNYIEVPSWCSDAWPHPCGGDKTDAYHLGDVPYLHPKVFNVVELASLALLIAQVRPRGGSGRCVEKCVLDSVGLLQLLPEEVSHTRVTPLSKGDSFE